MSDKLSGLAALGQTMVAPRFSAFMPLGQTTTEVPAYQRARMRGIGMEYTDHPAPGDYHVNGNGVVLRALPQYESEAIATLQNGEGVYVFGDVETDPAYWILANDQVVTNPDPQKNAGIDYVRVGTQAHGAGWIAMPYIEPGAGTKVQPSPQPSPSAPSSPSSSPKTSAVPYVVGTLIGVAVLSGIALYIHSKGTRQLALA